MTFSYKLENRWSLSNNSLVPAVANQSLHSENQAWTIQHSSGSHIIGRIFRHVTHSNIEVVWIQSIDNLCSFYWMHLKSDVYKTYFTSSWCVERWFNNFLCADPLMLHITTPLKHGLTFKLLTFMSSISYQVCESSEHKLFFCSFFVMYTKNNLYNKPAAQLITWTNHSQKFHLKSNLSE